MIDNAQLSMLASLVLPPSILDFFDVTGMDVEVVDPKPGDFYTQVVHIYLDEKDNRTDKFKELRPNGFTEPTAIEDFPIRDRKMVLHVRRRRWLDKENHNVIIKAQAEKPVHEFGRKVLSLQNENFKCNMVMPAPGAGRAL